MLFEYLRDVGAVDAEHFGHGERRKAPVLVQDEYLLPVRNGELARARRHDLLLRVGDRAPRCVRPGVRIRVQDLADQIEREGAAAGILEPVQSIGYQRRRVFIERRRLKLDGALHDLVRAFGDRTDEAVRLR